MRRHRNLLRAFTVIETVLIIAIIMILIGIVTVALKPGQNLAKNNNAERKLHLISMIEAINKYQAAHNGQLPEIIMTEDKPIGSGADHINLCPLLVDSGYLAGMPYDKIAPGAHYSSCADYQTGYLIKKTAKNQVVLNAPSAELGEIITQAQ